MVTGLLLCCLHKHSNYLNNARSKPCWYNHRGTSWETFLTTLTKSKDFDMGPWHATAILSCMYEMTTRHIVWTSSKVHKQATHTLHVSRPYCKTQWNETVADEVDPDTAIVAADPLSQQALECQAEDMAIEDTLYALERALTDGHLPSDTYLKQVRLSRHFYVALFMLDVLKANWALTLSECSQTKHTFD